MARRVSVLIDTSGSMAEDCKGAVVKYVLNAIVSVSEEDDKEYKFYLVGNELTEIEDSRNFKIFYGGQLSLKAIKSVFDEDCEGYLFISDGCFDSEIEAFLSKHNRQIVTVAIGADAMRNNLQRCSKHKNVFQASDVVAAIKAI